MNKVIIIHYEEDPEAISKFKILSQRLWSEHNSYTRNGIISALAGLPDLGDVMNRLMRNQEDIGQFIAPYYGAEAATSLTNLLKEHINIAANIVVAASQNKSTADLEATWQANAVSIADLLASLDPVYWSKNIVLPVLQQHLACTLKEIVSRSKKDWLTDIAAYDDCSAVVAVLAEVIAYGIVYNFPEEFIIQYKSKSFKKVY